MIVLFNLGLVCGTGRETAGDFAHAFALENLLAGARGPGVAGAGGDAFWGRAAGLRPDVEQGAIPRNGYCASVSCKPWTPPLLKWDKSAEDQNRDTLLTLTNNFTYRQGSGNNVELVIWPEAASCRIFFQGPSGSPAARPWINMSPSWGCR